MSEHISSIPPSSNRLAQPRKTAPVAYSDRGTSKKNTSMLGKVLEASKAHREAASAQGRADLLRQLETMGVELEALRTPPESNSY